MADANNSQVQVTMEETGGANSSEKHSSSKHGQIPSDASALRDAALLPSCCVARTHCAFINPACGKRYGLPGVGESSTGFMVPMKTFLVNEIVGKYLVHVQWNTDSVCWEYERSASGHVVLSGAPVAGLISSEGEHRAYGTLQSIVNQSTGMINVFFGSKPVVERFYDKPLMSLDGVMTPPDRSPRDCTEERYRED